MRKNFNEARTKAKRNKKRNLLDFMAVDFEMWGCGFHVNVLLVPLAIAVGYHRHLKDEYWKSLEWDEKKAEKLLDKSLGKVLEWDEDNGAYWFCMNWNSRYLTDRAPFGMRTWARKFNNEVLKYLENGYHHPIYRKLAETDCWGDKWLKFEEYGYINGKKDNQEVTGERQAEMDKNIPEI